MLYEIFPGVLLELGDANPAVAGFDQLGFHALHADDVAGEGDLEGLRLALPQDGEPDVRFRLATHALDRLVQGHALDRGVVDLDDEIPGLQAGAKCRRVLDGRDDLDETFLHAHLDAEAAELALGAHLKLAERVLVQISRVRIEPGKHAADRFSDELLVLHRLDVARLDRAEHFGEGAQLIHRKRETRRLALGHRGEIQAEQNSCQHANQHQAGLSDLGHHDIRSWALRRPFWHRIRHFKDTQRMGSKAFPSCRISKYRPDSMLPPLAPTVATASPVRTGSPICLSTDSLLP